MKEELAIARHAALAAGRVLMKHYGKVQASQKKDGTLVTAADGESERLIKKMLSRAFPSYSFLGEEGGLDEKGSEFRWVVDPLDGTTNYSMKNPFFNVSIGLLRRNEPVLGVVFSPIQKELFCAVRGKGAFMNGKRIRVSGGADVRHSKVAFCHGRDERSVDVISGVFHSMKHMSDTFRQMGAGALELCYVACGRLDAFLSAGIKPWDVAAGILIVREAGGLVTDFSGAEYGMYSPDILASNGKMHAELMRILGPSAKL
ncbi:MAG: inositol monophosphatase family protein [Candidatus Aenigmatarchaeota archaeon]